MEQVLSGLLLAGLSLFNCWIWYKIGRRDGYKKGCGDGWGAGWEDHDRGIGWHYPPMTTTERLTTLPRLED